MILEAFILRTVSRQFHMETLTVLGLTKTSKVGIRQSESKLSWIQMIQEQDLCEKRKGFQDLGVH